MCRARPQIQPRARVHAACLRWCWTRRCPPLLWVPLGAFGPGPWLQELVGGSWQEGRCAVFPGIAGWLPMGTHPVAVDAPSTQHWGQEQQQTGDS